jgi:tetratricopeptide (TPR) repeat protein
MPTLSVVMIVKNEAEWLPACLESVRAIVDEMVVADTGSTDETAALAQAGGAKMISIPWEDDFAKARNHAMEDASGDWLLQIDADEQLDAAGARKIRAIVDADGDGADAIELIQANYCNQPRAWRWEAVEADAPYARGHAGYLHVDIVRLFRLGRGYEYREAIHENVTESIQETGGVIRHEDILLHHYGFSEEGPRADGKARKYLGICRRKADEYPENVKAWRDLAEQAWACGEEAETEEACRRALALEPLHLDTVTTLGSLLMCRGNHGEAEVLFSRLEGAGISPPHVQVALAALNRRAGRLEEALKRLEATLAAVPEHTMAQLELARVQDRLGETDAATQALEGLHRQAPAVEEFGQLLEARRLRFSGEEAFQRSDAGGALGFFVEALGLDGEDPFLHNDLGVALHALGDQKRARESFQRALALAPGLGEAEENLGAFGA